MAFIRFNPGTIVNISGSEYRPDYSHGRVQLTHTTTGGVFRCEQPDGTMEMPDLDQFLDMQATGAAITRLIGSTNAIRAYNHNSDWTLDHVGKQGKRVKRMLVICQELDDRGIGFGHLETQRALDEFYTPEMVARYGRKPSAAAVRKWRQTRGRVGMRRVRDMVLLNGRKITDIKLNTVNQKILWASVYAGRKERRPPKWIWADYIYQLSLVNEGRHPTFAKPEIPYKAYCRRTVRRYFNAIESDENLPTTIAKEAAKQDWSGAGKSLSADLVMQYVIVDHTWLDCHIVCPHLRMLLGRPWLTLAIDVKSRAIVGWLITFHDPSSWSVAEIMRRIVRPKRPPAAMVSRYPMLAYLCGKPGCLILDNAVEFRSHNLEAAARDAGFSVRFCPIAEPTYRAVGERAIKTINQQVAELLPGATITINDARRYGYNAEAHAVVMLDELEAIMNQIIACYNVTPHEGINGLQPALVFENYINTHGINDFADFESFARDVMAIEVDVQLSNTGIRAFGLRYGGSEITKELLRDLVPIEPRRQRRVDATATVDFRYDAMNISQIHVWNRRTRKYVTLRCTDERYSDGMPLWLHQYVQEEAKRAGLAFNTEEERGHALGVMVEAIKNIDPTAFAASRKRMAELSESPRLRRMTGNIVDLVTAPPSAVRIGDFIANDRARLTALDDIILSPRPDPRKKRAKTALDQRRENVALAQRELEAPIRERRLPGRGGF